MIVIGDYTDTDQARAIAGLTDNEVSDLKMVAMGLSAIIATDLYTWMPTHSAIKAAAEAASPTAAELIQFEVLKLYASTLAAVTVLESSMHIPQQYGNGKDIAKRFTDKSLKESILALQGRLLKYRNQLLDMTAPAGAANSGLFALAAPTYDPVTNV